jgi:hypothetical protein
MCRWITGFRHLCVQSTTGPLPRQAFPLRPTDAGRRSPSTTAARSSAYENIRRSSAGSRCCSSSTSSANSLGRSSVRATVRVGSQSEFTASPDVERITKPHRRVWIGSSRSNQNKGFGGVRQGICKCLTANKLRANSRPVISCGVGALGTGLEGGQERGRRAASEVLRRMTGCQISPYSSTRWGTVSRVNRPGSRSSVSSDQSSGVETVAVGLARTA